MAKKELIKNADWRAKRYTRQDPGTRDRIYGVELEVETGHYDIEDRAELVADILPRGLKYQLKPDGSLTRGIEINLNPASIHWYRDQGFIAPTLRCIAAANITSWDNGNCGMHIHTSPLGITAKANLRSFVVQHNNRIAQISGRNDMYFCRIPQHADGFFDDYGYPIKYRAIAFWEKTTEFRLWRGTLSPARFQFNLEFTDALCSWASQCTANQLAKWSAFTEWLDYRHKSVMDFMRQHSYA